MSFFIHVESKKKDILFFDEGHTQGLAGTTLTTEKMYVFNLTATKKRFCFSLQYNGATRYLFVNSTETRKFDTKDSEIVAVLFCLGNISEHLPTDNMKKNQIDWICL